MENDLTLTASTHTITVGAGGPGGSFNQANGFSDKKAAVQSYNGKDSSISGTGVNITAIGGGGGCWKFDLNISPGGDGGSGGGGNPAGTGVQGNNGSFHWEKSGGGGYSSIYQGTPGEGGGGAGLAKTDIPAAVDVQNIPAVFAEGGFGGGSNTVSGANPAGGVNTGSGGGAGRHGSYGAAGGSGIVIVRFLHTTVTP
jgi:hypothetical protein